MKNRLRSSVRRVLGILSCVVLWGGEVTREEWVRHSNYMQRVLLAQAVIGWAMMDC